MKTNEEKALEVLKRDISTSEKQDDFSNDALFEVLKSYVDEKGFQNRLCYVANPYCCVW